MLAAGHQTICAGCLLQELEDQNRSLEGEIAELRELRDQEGFFGDAKELELELKVGGSSFGCRSRVY
jgi:TolA-binding protein